MRFLEKQLRIAVMGLAVFGARSAVAEPVTEGFEGAESGLFGNGASVVTDRGVNGTRVLRQEVDGDFTWAGFSIPSGMNKDCSVVQFDASFDSGYDGAIGLTYKDGSDAVDFGDFQAMIRHDGTPGGGIDYRSGDAYVGIDSFLAGADEWHRYVFVLDYAGQTYDLYVDRVPVASDVAFRAAGHDGSASLCFRGKGGGAMIDNIKVFRAFRGASSVPDSKLSLRLAVKDRTEDDEDHYEKEWETSTEVRTEITDTEMETCALSIRLKNCAEQGGVCCLDWFFLSEDVVTGEVGIAKHGRKQIRVPASTVLEDAFVSDPFIVTTVTRSWGRDQQSRWGWTYDGYIVLVTSGGKILAQDSNSSRYLSDKWLEKCRAAK